jgi:hypothetical protein
MISILIIFILYGVVVFLDMYAMASDAKIWKQDIARGVLNYDIQVFILKEKDMSEEKMKEMESLICMSQEDIRAYIESQFTCGMSW